MDDKRGLSLSALAPWTTTIVAIAAAIFGYGQQSNRIDNLEQQVRGMQADARSNAATLAEIKDTVTVVRTKLDILLPTSSPKDRH